MRICHCSEVIVGFNFVVFDRSGVAIGLSSEILFDFFCLGVTESGSTIFTDSARMFSRPTRVFDSLLTIGEDFAIIPFLFISGFVFFDCLFSGL